MHCQADRACLGFSAHINCASPDLLNMLRMLACRGPEKYGYKQKVCICGNKGFTIHLHMTAGVASSLSLAYRCYCCDLPVCCQLGVLLSGVGLMT